MVTASFHATLQGLPGGSVVKNPPASQEMQVCRFNPWVGKIPWRKTWQHTPVFLPGKSMDRGVSQSTVHGVAMSPTQFSNWACTLLSNSRHHSVPCSSGIWLPPITLGCPCCWIQVHVPMHSEAKQMKYQSLERRKFYYKGQARRMGNSCSKDPKSPVTLKKKIFNFWPQGAVCGILFSPTRGQTVALCSGSL